MSVRITQVVTEVLRNSSTSNARVTQVVAEVLRNSSTAKARVTQVVAEVLVTSAGNFRPVSATSGLTFSYSSTNPGKRYVSAKNNLLMSINAYGRTSPVHASASTGIILSGPGSAYGYGNKVVSAKSGFILSISDQTHSYGNKVVSGSSGVILSISDNTLNNGSKPVSATSGLVFSLDTEVLDIAVWRVSALSKLTMSVISTASFNRSVKAQSGVILSGPGKSGKNISVAATTNMSLSEKPIPSNFFHISSTSSILLSVNAAVVLGHTPALTGLIFTTAAFATTRFPWRFSPLVLPTGGGLPHS